MMTSVSIRIRNHFCCSSLAQWYGRKCGIVVIKSWVVVVRSARTLGETFSLETHIQAIRPVPVNAFCKRVGPEGRETEDLWSTAFMMSPVKRPTIHPIACRACSKVTTL